MEIFIFLSMNLAAGISAFLLAYRIFKANDILAFFLLYFAQIVMTEMFLGVLGMMSLQNLILLNFAILGAVFLFARKELAVYRVEEPSGERAYPEKFFCLLWAILAGFVAVKTAVNLMNAPFGWDNLNYHFTFPVEWLKNGDLTNPIVISDDFSPTYYPLNGSLVFLWYIFPFKSAFLADIAQLAFFIISFIAIRKIGQKLGLPDKTSLLAAFAFVFIPNFFKQLQVAYVDMMVAGFFLTALYFLFSVREELNLKNVFFYSVSMGLLIGTKSTGFVYGALLILPFLFLALKGGKRKLTPKLAYLACAVSIMTLLGGFTYIRNYLSTANPFYPLEVSFLGRVIFPGVIDKAVLSARNMPGDYSLSKILFHEGMGIQTLLLILPCALLALPAVFLRKKEEGLLKYFLLLPVMLYLAFRFLIPLPNTRYLYPALGAGILVAFRMMDSLKLPLKAIKAVSFVCVFAALFEIARKAELGASFGLSVLIFALFLAARKYHGFRRFLFSPFVVSSSLALFVVLFQLLAIDYKNFEYISYVRNSRFWPDATRAWLWLNENTYSSNIAYAGRPVPYPLYGTGFKNNVFYVSVNPVEPARLEYFPGSRYRWTGDAITMHKNFEEPLNYRGKADYRVWLSNLKKRRADYLFVYSLHHTKDTVFPLEDSWARQHAEEFVPVFANETVRIYRLRPS